MRTAAKKQAQASPLAAPTVPELLQVIEQKDHLIEELQRLLALKEEQLRLAKQRRFGASSEKLPFQGDFFDEAELEQALSDVEKQLAEAGEPAPIKPPCKKR